MTTSNPVLVAIDRKDLEGAQDLARQLTGHVGGIKLGLEFFTANGSTAIQTMAELKLPIFLDLKLHDIPNTVAGAMAAVGELPIQMVTIHASGGQAMIEAAANAAQRSQHKPWVLAVTVLTSMDKADLEATGVQDDTAEQVLRLGRLAINAGADGLICSPLEIKALRAELGQGPKLVVPGIRLVAGGDDQKRTMTPKEAVDAGATRLVIGRPITQAPDPVAAADGIWQSIK